MPWRISGCDDYLKRVKEFGKKYPHEIRAVAQNLRTLMNALDLGTKPEQLKLLGFVHGNYDLGILSLDETGHDKPSKPKALRLYVYPCIEEQVVYAMLLGQKDGQQADVKLCKHFVQNKIESLNAANSQASRGKPPIPKQP